VEKVKGSNTRRRITRPFNTVGKRVRLRLHGGREKHYGQTKKSDRHMREGSNNSAEEMVREVAPAQSKEGRQRFNEKERTNAADPSKEVDDKPMARPLTQRREASWMRIARRERTHKSFIGGQNCSGKGNIQKDEITKQEEKHVSMAGQLTQRKFERDSSPEQNWDLGMGWRGRTNNKGNKLPQGE